MGHKSYEEACELPLGFIFTLCKKFGPANLYPLIAPGRNCGRDDFVFAYKLNNTAMIFPFGVQFHAEQRLFVCRPRGALNEEGVTDVVAALGQLEMELHEPFNRFLDTAGVSAVDINYEYVFTVALYRRFAYADRPPIKSAILATHPTLVDYGKLHALVTGGSSIDVRVFPDDRPAVAQWLNVPVELIAADSTSSSMA